MAKKFSDPNLFTKTWKKEGALTKNDPSENLTKDCSKNSITFLVISPVI